jgi:hypothetical protein
MLVTLREAARNLLKSCVPLTEGDILGEALVVSPEAVEFLRKEVMPYKSAKQRAYLHVKKPKLAAKWDKRYGGKIAGKKKVSKK